MIYTDGECPICIESKVRLNTWDLMECPRCHLMFSLATPCTATVIKSRGEGKFREQNCNVNPMVGLLLAPSKAGYAILPDDDNWFENKDEIITYLDEAIKES